MLYKSNTKVIHKIFTSYSIAVDKILLRVYSYTQVKSYIRVETVDKYHLCCGQLLPRGKVVSELERHHGAINGLPDTMRKTLIHYEKKYR